MALATNIYDYSATRGDTIVHQITVKNSDETVKDISGATVKYTIRESYFDGTQVLQKTVGSGIVLTNPTQGELQVTISATETATLSPTKKYVYDCEITLSGMVQTVQEGQIRIKGDVSQ